MRIHRLSPARGAFTLVEILVVLGIMIILMSLAVVVASSGLIDNHRLSAGADRVSGWLMQARAKAFRDRLPRGVRFIPDASGYVREAQFIEVPEPYVPNPDGSDTGFKLAFRYRERNRAPGPGTYIAKEIFIIKNPSSTAAELEVARSEIAVYDTLKISSFTSLHRIVNVVPTPVTVQWGSPPVPTVFQALKVVLVDDPFQTPPPVQADTPKLPDLGGLYTPLSDPGYATAPFQNITTGFAIIRQARPMLGEQPLKFSANTAIQIVAGQTLAESITSMSLLPVYNGNYDVLFGATGEVQHNAGLGRVVLWMRNPDFAPSSFASRNANVDDRAAYERAGEMALITVYCKTGAVATHPVQLPPGGPTMSPNHAYQYTKDGIASGL